MTVEGVKYYGEIKSRERRKRGLGLSLTNEDGGIRKVPQKRCKWSKN
jgi:hypothetical protein